ncbi:MAG: rolling circle replication-associated protein [Bacteroidota bacterium]
MSKIKEMSRLSRTFKEFLLNGKIERQLLGLSNCPNLTASGEISKISCVIYPNGEGHIRKYKDQRQNRIHRPPLHEGERINKKGLSMKAASKVKRCIRILSYYAEKLEIKKIMITLTYGRYFPDDHTAKKHLDAFFKRLNRKQKKKNQWMINLWVAEKQKRGAIHFHIFNLGRIEKEFVNKAWNEIVQRWQIKSGFERQEIYPNIIVVEKPSGYLAKYISKSGMEIHGNLYGMSKGARNICEPIGQNNFSFDDSIINSVISESLRTAKIPEDKLFKVCSENQPLLIWFAEGGNRIFEKFATIKTIIDHGKTQN